MVRSHKLAVGAVVPVLGAVIVAGALTVIAGGRHDHRLSPARSLSAPAPVTPPPSSSSSAGWSVVAPATTVPGESPVQQHYDQGFERGFASAANQAELARIEAVRLPAPGRVAGWPALAVSDTPDGWAREFVTGLLDIDFARQTRTALGSWLVAAEAPDLMPGVPAAGQEGELYATVLDPGVTGQPTPIPAPAEWAADSAAGVR